MDSHWLAWLGGLVDGEGTIGLHRSNAKRFKHPYIGPHIQIVNTDTRLLHKAADIIEGVTGKHPSLVVSNKGGNGQKRGYRLKVGTQWEAVMLLPILRPYLVGKGEQADIVLAFAKRKYARLRYQWYEHAAEDQADYAKCLALNRRGADQLEQMMSAQPEEDS